MMLHEKRMMLLPIRMMAFTVLTLILSEGRTAIGADVEAARKKVGIQNGICAVLGLPKVGRPGFVTDLAQRSELMIYFQSPDSDEVAGVRTAADATGLLGKRIFASRGDWKSIHLADNLAVLLETAPLDGSFSVSVRAV